MRAIWKILANQLEEHLKEVPLVVSEVALSWECLKTKWDMLSVCNDEIYNLMLADATEEDLIAVIA